MVFRESLDGDDTALAEYLTKLNGMRATRVKTYLSEDSTFHDMAVYVLRLRVSDERMYEMLGGADRGTPPCKAEALLDRQGSSVDQTLTCLRKSIDTPWVLHPTTLPLCDGPRAKSCAWLRRGTDGTS